MCLYIYIFNPHCFLQQLVCDLAINGRNLSVSAIHSTCLSAIPTLLPNCHLWAPVLAKGNAKMKAGKKSPGSKYKGTFLTISLLSCIMQSPESKTWRCLVGAKLLQWNSTYGCEIGEHDRTKSVEHCILYRILYMLWLQVQTGDCASQRHQPCDRPGGMQYQQHTRCFQCPRGHRKVTEGCSRTCHNYQVRCEKMAPPGLYLVEEKRWWPCHGSWKQGRSAKWFLEYSLSLVLIEMLGVKKHLV